MYVRRSVPGGMILYMVTGIVHNTVTFTSRSVKQELVNRELVNRSTVPAGSDIMGLTITGPPLVQGGAGTRTESRGIVNLSNIVIRNWTLRQLTDLYNAVKHLFLFRSQNSGTRRYETVSWESFYNLPSKRRGVLYGEQQPL
jgi:hypothetical protein